MTQQVSSVGVSQAVGARTFVIGDLHGCPDEPEILLKHLEKEEGLVEEDLVVFLGDYIDRGPNSKAVIDLMLDFRSRFPNTRFLKGNHEDMLLDFLGFGGNLGQAFLYNGGLETIQSYGISVFAPPTEMVSALPPEHFKFFRELESVLEINDFVCVHAGLNPAQAMTEQTDNDVYWIRDEFLNYPHSYEKTVVFGHTPHQEIFVHFPFKIGLDTGLVFGNKLSCLELTSGKVFQIRREEKKLSFARLDMSAINFSGLPARES